MSTAEIGKQDTSKPSVDTPPSYRYSLVSLRYSSERYGNCEVCKRWACEVFHQREQRRYSVDGKSGWTAADCSDLFGHESCLMSRRKPNHQVVPRPHMAAGSGYVND